MIPELVTTSTTTGMPAVREEQLPEGDPNELIVADWVGVTVVELTVYVHKVVPFVDSSSAATIVTAELPCGTRTVTDCRPLVVTVAPIISTFSESAGEVLWTAPMRPLSHMYIITAAAMAITISRTTATMSDIDLLKAATSEGDLDLQGI